MKCLPILAGWFWFALFACGEVLPPPAATQAEVNAGTVARKYVSPATLAGNTNLMVRSTGTNLWVTNGMVISTNTSLMTAVVVSPTNVVQVGLTGSTNLTSSGGGVGVYSLITPVSINPANATTYYLGSFGGSLVTTAASAQIVIPASCTLRQLYVNVRISGTSGSSENVSCYVTNLTKVTGTTSSTMTWTTGSRPLTMTGLSLACSAGDDVAVVFVTPTWSTLPTAVFAEGFPYFGQ